MIVQTYGTSEGTIHLVVTGEIDIATSSDFETALSAAARTEGTTKLIVDFSGVDFCDSTGLAALDRAYGEAALRGVTLRVVKPQRGVYRLLEIMGMAEHLTGPAFP